MEKQTDEINLYIYHREVIISSQVNTRLLKKKGEKLELVINKLNRFSSLSGLILKWDGNTLLNVQDQL